ncbi:MAG: hypothetical protein FJZ60_00300 [Chlamydiae bacterium]|nr:hypothetical protein [Chlamydiota bacterium]
MLIDTLQNQNIPAHLLENIPQLNGNIPVDTAQKIQNYLASDRSLSAMPQQQSSLLKDPLEQIRNLGGQKPSEFPFNGGKFTFLSKIKNAHLDDIHGLIKLGSKSIVSGSKDSTVKIWNVQDRSHVEIKSGVGDYTSWITSLSNINDNQFAVGTRDGFLEILDGNGAVLSSSKSPKTSNNATGCKERNEERINCISTPPSGDPSTYVYVGRPQFLEIFDRATKTFIRSIKAHQKDWVWAISPLENQKIVLAVGSQLELWNLEKKPHLSNVLIPRASFSEKSTYKPFITHLCPIKGQKGILAAAYFDGNFKIYSFESQTERTFADAHVGRIWSLLSYDANLLLSSADDKTVCLWDLRMKKRVAKITDFPGRVSSLLQLDSTMFATASCPDEVFTAQNKAEIQFFDLKKV